MSDRHCRQCGTLDCGHKQPSALRAAHLSREHQQMARAHVQRSSLQRAGAKGFKALAEKRGFYAAAEFVAAWRKAHPSSIQLKVREWLVELGECFLEDEHLRHAIFPDFVLPARSVIVEVDGRGFHECTEWLGDDRQARAPIRERVMADEGFKVLHLSERAVRNGSARQALIDFISRTGGGQA